MRTIVRYERKELALKTGFSMIVAFVYKNQVGRRHFIPSSTFWSFSFLVVTQYSLLIRYVLKITLHYGTSISLEEGWLCFFQVKIFFSRFVAQRNKKFATPCRDIIFFSTKAGFLRHKFSQNILFCTFQRQKKFSIIADRKVFPKKNP